MKKNRKANIMIYIVFIISSISLLFIGAFVAPFGVRFNSIIYEKGEGLMLDANESINNIKDSGVKTSLQNTIGGALRNTQYNIELNSYFFKYSWVLVVGLTSFVLFVFTRQLTETYRGGVI